MARAGDRSRLGIKLGLRIIRKVRKNLTYVSEKRFSSNTSNGENDRHCQC